METLDFDIIIIGAGISGINTAYRIQTECPQHTYTILEQKEELGGTWSLFKYPGIRSDSDLYTFGFEWNRWDKPEAIAEAGLILKYLKSSAEKYGIDRRIQYGKTVVAADWETRDKVWSLRVQDKDADGESVMRCKFVVFATGYYDYNTPLNAQIPGLGNFKGRLVHPQFWPNDLELQDKKVVIIGSGATAITLLPSISKQASETVLLQRSPSYVLSQPQRGKLGGFLRAVLPASWASLLMRWKFILMPWILLQYCRIFPRRSRDMLRSLSARLLPPRISIDPHFSPRYNPFDQRLCLCPDGDFYAAFHAPGTSIVTGEIQEVEGSAIKLKNVEESLQADVIISATGLRLNVAGGVKISVDQVALDIPSKRVWKGTLIEDLPNASLVIGYTTASWTLGADCAAKVTTRVLNRMHRKGFASVTARVPKGLKMEEVPIINLSSTYVVKAIDRLPRAGSTGPWQPRVSYFKDYWRSQYGSIQTGLEYD
ncbi:FAD-containing monooxygenase EthA [Pseudocercospora fuligena]|uniref:FAD-containing monooxygenase EthA n=1 Tax=Pseudocercospora fuligena TaxID=685502 RepID=A0A8H6R654_9PEZI|nr:FAD-containing monooxygenase EthA [Pseudocercospora fuligena]